jgi:hypothetical protein
VGNRQTGDIISLLFDFFNVSRPTKSSAKNSFITLLNNEIPVARFKYVIVATTLG